MLWGTKNFIGRFTSYRINSSSKVLSFRFTATVSDFATVLWIYIYAVNGSPGNLRVGIQSDSNGNPSGSYLTSVDIAPSTGWQSCNITDYRLTSGSCYHIVMTPVSGYDATNYVEILFGDSKTVGSV